MLRGHAAGRHFDLHAVGVLVPHVLRGAEAEAARPCLARAIGLVVVRTVAVADAFQGFSSWKRRNER